MVVFNYPMRDIVVLYKAGSPYCTVWVAIRNTLEPQLQSLIPHRFDLWFFRRILPAWIYSKAIIHVRKKNILLTPK